MERALNLVQVETQSQSQDVIQEGYVEMDMDNNWNFGYVGSIYLGSDKQEIRALFDTGSANSWIIGVESLEGKANADDFEAFDKSTSTTW